MKKERSFLMGSDAIRAFKNGGASFLINCKDNYGIYKFTEGETLEEIMIKVVGWDEYLELNEKDLKEIKRAKNINAWQEFYSLIDPEDNMSDGEFIDYLYNHYEVPVLVDAEPGEIDLFEHLALVPTSVCVKINSFSHKSGDSYQNCLTLLRELTEEGYTFDFGLDGEPYNLRKI